jgi:hypothetical protein
MLMMKDYRKYFQYKDFIMIKQSRLSRLKDAALKAGDTSAYLRITTEIIRLNKGVLAINRKIKQLMDDMNKKMQSRYSRAFSKSFDERAVAP